MNVALELQFDETHRRPAAAWFVVGATVDEWLAELALWQTSLTEARLFVVSGSPRDRRPCGLFVVGASPPDGRGSPRSLPYAAAHRRLYVPCEARLAPATSDAELAELLGDDLHVWHPQAGLISLPASSARRVSELVLAPQASGDGWTAAVAGIGLNGKLVSLEPDSTPTAQDVLNEARGDIGSQPLDLGRMPPAPNEPLSGPLGDAGRAISRGIAKVAQWFAQHAPAGGDKPNWINALENWAQQRLRDLSQSLEAARNRELTRLMNLLKDDPDEGLKFALPMGGDAHRGVAPPSAQLGMRDVNFSLSGLQGGRPADVWNVPFDMQRRLLERYRELAAREIALGRHRRAAYIYASLLNDVRSAAATLQDGGHFREAAALYDERLRQPELAAECLRKGRCWNEAIAIYERLGRHETIGDLYAELEQPAEAEAAWRRAVAEKLNADDVLSAAKLLDGKLASPDEAYDRLTDAWPNSNQAQQCLREAFALSARQERHERAAALVVAAAESHRNSFVAAPLVDVLVEQARDYPDEAVRRRAADRTRLVVAERLGANIEPTEATRLVTAVGKLVPEDRLLTRDGHRYLNEYRRRQAQPRKSTYQVQNTPTLVCELRLPPLDWKAAVATDEAIYAAGFRDRELVVVRTDWRGGAPEEPIGPKWEIEPGQLENPIALVADSLHRDGVIVHVFGNPTPLANSRWFQASDRFPSVVTVGTHRGLSDCTYSICRSGRETIYVVNLGEEGRFVANAFSSHAQLGGATSVDLMKSIGDDYYIHYPLPTAVSEETLCVGLGHNLCFTNSRIGLRILELPHPVRQLVASPPRTRTRLAVSMEQGGIMLWGSDDRAAQSPFASELESPQIALTRDGTLVAVAADALETYSTNDGKLQFRNRMHGPGIAPIAALSSRQSNRCGILLGDGRLQLYDVPPRLA